MKKIALYNLAAGLMMALQLHSQSITVATVPPLAGGNGSAGVTFNVSASTTPIIIDTVLCAFYGPGQVELWYSPTPINGAPTVSQANGFCWVRPTLSTSDWAQQIPYFNPFPYL